MNRNSRPGGLHAIQNGHIPSAHELTRPSVRTSENGFLPGLREANQPAERTDVLGKERPISAVAPERGVDGSDAGTELTGTVVEQSGTKWLGSPTTDCSGTLAQIREFIPTFARRGFSFAEANCDGGPLSKRLDTIVRLPHRNDRRTVPISLVSKEYVLVPHMAVLDVAIAALKSVNIEAADVEAALRLTEYGERMHLSVYLPDEYRFNPRDNNPMALRLECLNSVDGSMRFRALIGWFRFVCANGLVLGVTRYDMRRRHLGDLWLDDIGRVLSTGLTESRSETANFQTWQETEVTENRLTLWVNQNVKEMWGFKAAARAFHIARTGFDVVIAGPYKGHSPATVQVKQTLMVPGAPPRSRNLFDVSQVLAWLAKERREIQEQLEWREQIPGLLDALKVAAA